MWSIIRGKSRRITWLGALGVGGGGVGVGGVRGRLVLGFYPSAVRICSVLLTLPILLKV